MKQALRHAAFALVGAAVLMVSPGPAHALEKIKVTMAAYAANYAPYLVAVDKGYFKKEGFKVQIIKAGGGIATPALMSGSIDFSTSGASAVSAILRGSPLRVIFFPWDRVVYQIWATDPKIKTLSDLKGKQIGVQTRGDTLELGVRIVLMRHHINPDAVAYMPLGYSSTRIAAIAAKTVPAAVLAPDDVDRLRNAGKLHGDHLLYDMYNKVMMPLTGTAVSASMLQKHPKRVKRFLRAVEEGLAYTKAFEKGTVDILQKYNKKAKRASTVATYKSTLMTITADGTIPVSLQRQYATLVAQVIHVAKDKIPQIDKIYNFRLAREVAKELAAAHWKPTS